MNLHYVILQANLNTKDYDIYNIESDEIASITTNNAVELFNLDK